MGVDGNQLGAAYRRQARSLLRYFARATWDGQSAADLVGETFAAALEGRGSFRGDATDGDAVDAWLYGVARNQLARFARSGAIERRAMARFGIRRAEPEPDEIERIEELAGLAELRERVADSLAGLGDASREAVRLRVVDELGYDEVAERLGISEQTARARVSRGLRSLGEALARDPEGNVTRP